MVVVCYTIQDEDTFKGENEAYTQECRGITFDREGKIASRTMHKFENVGQSDTSQPENIPWERIVRIMDKKDGSMITFLEIDGQIVGKTKKTFTSNEAIAATEFLHKDATKVAWVRDCLSQGFTPTFEWTSPRFPIVLTYKQDELTLLQIRHNVSGIYKTLWSKDQLLQLPFPIIKDLLEQYKEPRELLEDAKTLEGIEGWVVQIDDGRMWKIKTRWYCKLHRLCVFLRVRDVAEIVLDDKFDDLLGMFKITGRGQEETDKAKKIQRAVLEHVKAIKQQVSKIVQAGAGLTPKDMALQHKDHEFFSLIMSCFRGKEVNYPEWFKRHYLHTYSLEILAAINE